MSRVKTAAVTNILAGVAALWSTVGLVAFVTP